MPIYEQNTGSGNPSWAEWSPRIISQYNLKLMSGGEHHGPCPSCGGKRDRFWIKNVEGEVKAFCRQGCGIKELSSAMRRDGVWPEFKPNGTAAPAADMRDFDDLTPYHVRKGIPLLGAKLDGANVIVPVYNAQKEPVSHQRITPDGEKKWPGGAKVEGCFTVVGGRLEGLCYIAEGWATAVAVSLSTGRPCIFALNTANLPKVSKILGDLYPDVKLIVAADNDKPGIEAAEATGLTWVAPEAEKQDWWDVWHEKGPQAVKGRLESLGRHPLANYVPAMEGPLQAPEFVLDGVIAAGMVLLAGGWGAGKTTQLVPLLCRAAHLCKIDDPLKPLLRRRVVYISEDIEQLRIIMRAMAANGEFDGIDDTEIDDYFKMVPAYRMTADKIVGVAEEYKDLDVVNKNPGVGPDYAAKAVIIFDTRSSTIEIGDENDNTEVGRVIATLRQGFPNNPIVIVAHIAKNMRRADAKDLSGRGAGAWEADAQQVLYLTNDDGIRWLDVASPKHRFATEYDGIEFTTVSVDLETQDVFGRQNITKARYGDPRLVHLGGYEQGKKLKEGIKRNERMDAVLDVVSNSWNESKLVNREAVKRAVHGGAQATTDAINALIADDRLLEFEIPADIRKNNNFKNALYPLSGIERDEYVNHNVIPKPVRNKLDAMKGAKSVHSEQNGRDDEKGEK